MRHVALALLMLTATPALAADPPNVVTTIVPIHALAASVMRGVGEPKLLVKGGASPHGFQMKPSDMRAVRAADLTVWVGPEMEGFLVKPLQGIAADRQIELMGLPAVHLLEAREGGVWAPHDHGDHEAHEHADGKEQAAQDHDDHDHDGHGHEHAGEEHDPHLWLDPTNAIHIVEAIGSRLAAIDPAHATAYQANVAKTVASLKKLDAELATTLAPVGHQPFIVLHDAYQYLEERYDLTAVGSITVTPDRQPSARRLSELRAVITAREAVCVFDEPQVNTGLVATIAEGTGARFGRLDPEGSASLEPGPDAYEQLMRRNAAALKACLALSS